jgi:hypothetical protein
VSNRAGPGTGRTSAPQRSGLFSRRYVAPMESMPRISAAFGRGLIATWSSPVVVVATLGWLLAEWLVIVALGYPGPFAVLAYVSATAPLSTTTDLSVSIGLLGAARGLTFVFVTGAVHALWYSLLVGLTLETVESGRASRWGAIRGLRAFPVAFAIHVIGVAVLFVSQLIAGLGGGGFTFILQIAALVLAVWALVFAPVIAVAEHRRLMDSLGRSVRAARLPGSGNLSAAAIYVVPVFATFVATVVGRVPGAELDVNPPFTAWIFVVVMNLLHVAMLAAFTIRYLAVADEVPDAPTRRSVARDVDRGGARSPRTPQSTRSRRRRSHRRW